MAKKSKNWNRSQIGATAQSNSNPESVILPIKRARKVEPFVVSVASGKGGVGKTLTTINLAIAARSMGHRVLIVDGDFGLSNVDVLLGLQPKHNVSEVIDDYISMDDLLMEGPEGIQIIPSGSGLTRLQDMSFSERQTILDRIKQLEKFFDIIFIDTGAGIGANVLHLNAISQKRIVVCTPEPHSITDAYAFIKVMSEEKDVRDFELLINMSNSEREAKDVAYRIIETSVRFLNIRPKFLGSVPTDDQILKSVKSQKMDHSNLDNCVAGQAWHQIAQKCFATDSFRPVPGSPKKFWSKFLTT